MIQTEIPNNLLPVRFLSEKKAAACMDAHPQTLKRWRAQGRGPKFLRLGGRIRYTPQAIQEYISSCVIDPATAATARNRARRRQSS